MGFGGITHWLILGVVILLLFGGNRFSSMMGDVAKGLKSFKQGMADDDRPADPRALPPGQQPPTPFQHPQPPYGQDPQQPYGQAPQVPYGQSAPQHQPPRTIDLSPHPQKDAQSQPAPPRDGVDDQGR